MPRPRARALATLVLLLVLGSGAQALAASDFTVTLSVAVSGATATYTATACGSGKKEGPVSVGLYYNQSAAPSCATTPSHQWSVPQLGSGVCEVLTHVRTGVAVGSYTAWALVDSTCAFVETVEGNNTASWAYKVQPDLSLTALTAVVSGTDVTYTITVKNTGVSSGPFSVGLYYDRSTAPTCNTGPDQTLTVSAGLELNQSTTLTYARTGVPVGSYTAWAFADQGCTITEASETNNASSTVYDLGPNIYVLTPVVTVTATTVLYSVTVCANYSSENLGSFTVGLWYHRATAPSCGLGGQDHLWTVASLTKGSCTTLTHTRSAVPPGSYTAQVFADPGCTLSESRESDNTRSRAYAVGAPNTPDLTASGFTATVSGTTVTYKVTICNQGAAATGFSVGLYDHATTAPSCTTTASSSWTVASLGSTLCQTLSTTRSAVAVGSYKAWVLADSGCVIAEASESNNVTSADYGVGLPELAITNLSAAVSGNQVSYTAQVCSSGTAITTPFSVGIYFDRPSAPSCSDAPDASQTISSLAAGVCAQATSIQPAAGIGAHKAWAFADNLCQVTEGNEDNNLRSYDFGVGVDQPDLRITNLTVTSTGASATYVVTVCNAGVAAAAALELGVYYGRTATPQCGDPADWSASLASLAPGDCETRTHTRSNAPTGSFKGWAFVDSGCQVGESDETNNTAGHSYTITTEKIDLTVTAFTVTRVGSGVLFLATVCNLGSSRSVSTITALYHDRADPPAASCTDTPDLKARLDPLDPGQCVNQSLARKTGPAGSYKAWVQVDGECALSEADESNNGASVAYTLTPASPADAGLDSLGGEGGVGGDGCSCQLEAAAPGPLGFGLVVLALLLGRRRCRRIPCDERSPRSRIGDE